MALAKKSFPAVLAVLIILLIINTAIARILPESSYYLSKNPSSSGYGTAYTDGILGDGLRVDYTVYNRDSIVEGSEEHQFTDGIGMSKQFLYAYQIYNVDGSDRDIGIFSLSGLGSNAITSYDYMSAAEDSFGEPGDQNNRGMLPSSKRYGTNAVDEKGYASWFFDESSIAGDNHSYWLIIQSDNVPVFGTYSFNEIEDVSGIPFDDPGATISPVPEPLTITLLGIGGLILRKTGKKVK